MACIARIFFNRIKTTNYRSLHQRIRFYASTAKDKAEEDDFDKPIKYSTSKAATWKAEYSFSGKTRENVTPWYQPMVVSGSLTIFMIYFFILREENDIDENLSMSLYDHVDGMEEVQVRNAINYYKEHEKGYDTSKLEKRLSELLEIKNKR